MALLAAAFDPLRPRHGRGASVAAAPCALNGTAAALLDRLPAFALWSACAVLYGAFWFAIIGYVASSNRRGESNIVRLLLCWTGLTLIVPAAVTAIAEAIYPPPSRLAYLADARRIEIETERAEGGIASSFFIDHPELVVDDASEMPAYLRTAFFVTSTVDDATRPVLDAFESTAARRDARSPCSATSRPPSSRTAYSTKRRALRPHDTGNYMAQARAFKAAYAEQAGPYIAAGRRMPSERVTAFPRFRFHDVPFSELLAGALPALAFLVLVASGLLLAADRRLRTAPPLQNIRDEIPPTRRRVPYVEEAACSRSRRRTIAACTDGMRVRYVSVLFLAFKLESSNSVCADILCLRTCRILQREDRVCVEQPLTASFPR